MASPFLFLRRNYKSAWLFVQARQGKAGAYKNKTDAGEVEQRQGQEAAELQHSASQQCKSHWARRLTEAAEGFMCICWMSENQGP